MDQITVIDGKIFECSQCGACCRHVDKLAKMKEYDRGTAFAGIYPLTSVLSIIKDRIYAGENTCIIYILKGWMSKNIIACYIIIAMLYAEENYWMGKDYIKIYDAVDAKRARQETVNIAAAQAAGAYPESFSYPVTLQFELTGACNLKCKHCYNRSGDPDRVQQTKMSPAKWKELAKQIVSDGGIFQCIISGGEPLLLGDDLFDIMDILHDDGTSFVVITNGMLLDKEKAKKFAKYRYFWFQISIDGSTAELHDSFRGVEKSWENAVNGAMEITARGIPLAIAHSVTPRTLPYLDDMAELAYAVGAGSIMIGEILPSGRAFYSDDILLTRKQRNYMYEKIGELSRKYANKLKIERSMNINSSMDRYLSHPNSGAIVRPNGDLRLDCMAPFVIGNALEDSIKSIWLKKGWDAWHDPKVLEFISSIDREEQKGNILNHVNDDIKL